MYLIILEKYFYFSFFFFMSRTRQVAEKWPHLVVDYGFVQGQNLVNWRLRFSFTILSLILGIIPITLTHRILQNNNKKNHHLFFHFTMTGINYSTGEYFFYHISVLCFISSIWMYTNEWKKLYIIYFTRCACTAWNK